MAILGLDERLFSLRRSARARSGEARLIVSAEQAATSALPASAGRLM
jgi:hypothetical protein